MPVTKRRPSVVPDTIKSEGNESIDTFIRQAIGKETLLSFSRTGDSTVQWIQLCHALDQQDLPGWPLLTPLKVPTQKCEKCSQKFCSSINYRRHTRVHRRSLNANKESYTNRDLLGAFWDKLSLDEAKEIVSFKDVNLEEVSGPSIVTALTSFICKPGFCVFPQVYERAGSILLDIIQCRPSSLPVSSEELFSILDAASEGTFLCAGTAESIKKYVFDGEAAKIGLEMRNLVACTSFLIEQKLVKAWVADKDAEALRCQKLLVEEEEAAQRRQAALLERKRQKKLRQKEQKAKEQTDGWKEELEVTFDTSGSPLSEEVASPLATPESDLCTSYIPSDDIQILVESVQFSNREDEDTEAQLGFSEYVDSTKSEWVKNQIVEGNNRQHVASAQWQVAKTHRGDGPNGFCTSQNLQVMKCGPVQKHAAAKDPRAATVLNIGKVWTRKSPTENDGKFLENIIRDTISQSDKNNCKVMIGSICVPVRNRTAPQQDDVLADAQENFSAVQGSQKMNSVQLRQVNADSVQCGDNRSIFKLWRPVIKDETSVNLPVQSGGHELEVDVKLDEVDDRTVNSENCQQSCSMKNHDRVDVDRSYLTLEEHGQPENLLFSRNAAKAFLARRWKDVISADHVRLVLSAELEPLGSPGAKVECQLEGPRSDCQRHTNGHADNQPATVELFKFTITKNTKTNSRVQFEKGVKAYS